MKRLALTTAALASWLLACRTIEEPFVVSAVPCLDRAGPLVTFTGGQTAIDEDLTENTKIDARTATWLDQGAEPVRVGGSGVCWSGGMIAGTFADTISWSAMHDTYGLLIHGPGAVIENLRMNNYGDGISFEAETAANWAIRDSHFSYLRDDCIENDFLNNGLVEDSFYDGCYDGYSARPYGGFTKDGSRHLVTIRHTLVRLQPMPTVYDGPAPGHAHFFKLDKDGRSPRLALHDNIFRVDQLPSHGDASSAEYFIPPPAKLAGCSNNIIVWLAPEEFPEPLPACYTLTRDKAVWDQAAAGWLAAHPAVAP